MRKKLDEQLLFKALDCAANGITIADCSRADFPLIFINKAFEEMTGYTVDEVYGKNCRFLQGRLTDQPELQEVRYALNRGHHCSVRLQNFRKNGELFWNELNLSPVYDEDERLAYYIGVQRDVTKEVDYAQQLEKSAITDELTGLLNVRGLYRKALSMLKGNHGQAYCAVGVIDLDNFKTINDTYGHLMGDKVLALFSESLAKQFDEENVVAGRPGGDEFFLFFLRENDHDAWFHKRIQRVEAVTKQAIGPDIPFSLSAGYVAQKIAPDTQLRDLLQIADQAMYRHKASKKISTDRQ